MTGLFVAMGILIPYITSHAAGVPGVVLLPMHIPVLLAGFFCGPRFGALAGLVTPLLSSLLTGMPPVFPMLPVMMAELTMYGFMGGLLYRKLRLPVFVALPAAMISGRAVFGMMLPVLLLAAPENMMLRNMSVWGAVTTGLPGIAIQLTLIPLIVGAMERRVPRVETWRPQLLRQASRIRSGTVTCIVMKDDKVVYEADGRGVAPLMELYDTDRQKFKGAAVADKIIGKAAAMIICSAQAAAVYGEIMSRAAVQYLTERGIDHRYGRCVDIISNRTGHGICPIEKCVLEIDDPHEGIGIIKQTISELKAKVQ
jgi:hypothetical protein